MSKKELCQKKKLQTLDEMRWMFLSVFVFFLLSFHPMLALKLGFLGASGYRISLPCESRLRCKNWTRWKAIQLFHVIPGQKSTKHPPKNRDSKPFKPFGQDFFNQKTSNSPESHFVGALPSFPRSESSPPAKRCSKHLGGSQHPPKPWKYRRVVLDPLNLSPFRKNVYGDYWVDFNGIIMHYQWNMCS